MWSRLKRPQRLLLLRFAMIALMTLPDETFSMGRDLTDAVHGLPARGPVRLTVGVVDSIPKLMTHRLVMPAWRSSSTCALSTPALDSPHA